jgi:hypothetical protein
MKGKNTLNSDTTIDGFKAESTHMPCECGREIFYTIKIENFG